MSKERLFGTDGVRGVANERLTADLALRLGMAAATWARQHSAAHEQFSVVVGRDTRLSGDMLSAALSAGLTSAGANVLDVGIVPTPAVSQIMLGIEGAKLGVVVSASHNPFEDNGIKFFGPNGKKLPDAVEDEIESIMARLDALPRPTGGDIGAIRHDRKAVTEYVTRVFHSVSPDVEPVFEATKDGIAVVDARLNGSATEKPLSGLRLIVDGANGAAYELAPQILRALGANVSDINTLPDGININVDCGSTHPQAMVEKVRQATEAKDTEQISKAVGLAFDGDADRVMLADEKGAIVDGDRMMAIIALHLHEQGKLPGDVVVATIMSNVGLETALAAKGIRLHRTDVGDRYVAAAMDKLGAAVGGEQSGHILLPLVTPTGDGLVTALQVLNVMHESGKPLSELAGVVVSGPQLLKNVRVQSKNGWREDPDILAAIARGREKLGSAEWLSVRPSGTEPLIRVMAQGTDKEIVESVVHDICDVIEKKLGRAKT